MTPRGLLSSALSTQLNIDLLLRVASRHSTLLTYMYMFHSVSLTFDMTLSSSCSHRKLLSSSVWILRVLVRINISTVHVSHM